MHYFYNRNTRLSKIGSSKMVAQNAAEGSVTFVAGRCSRPSALVFGCRAARLFRLVNMFGFSLALSGFGIAQASPEPKYQAKSDILSNFGKIPATRLISQRNKQENGGQTKILLAHAIVVRTSPPQGGTAPGNIGKVDVWYDAGIRDSLAALAVVSAGGERIDKRDAAIDSADPAHVSVSVNPMTAGKYTVRYRALSADGHMVSGAWDFEVKP